MKRPLLTRRAFLAAAASLVTAASLSACDSRLLRQLLLARAEQTTEQTVTPVSGESPAPTQQPGSQPAAPSPNRTLVAYFTWSGNTARMAEQIHARTGGDLLELTPAEPYPTQYTACGEVAQRERDTNARPALAGLPETLDGYDTLFIGYLIWWHTAPMVVGTFLEHYDLTGVKIYPFAQSASMDTEQFDNSMEFVRACAAGADVQEGLFARASDTAALREYLTQNGSAL